MKRNGFFSIIVDFSAKSCVDRPIKRACQKQAEGFETAKKKRSAVVNRALCVQEKLFCFRKRYFVQQDSAFGIFEVETDGCSLSVSQIFGRFDVKNVTAPFRVPRKSPGKGADALVAHKAQPHGETAARLQEPDMFHLDVKTQTVVCVRLDGWDVLEQGMGGFVQNDRSAVGAEIFR